MGRDDIHRDLQQQSQQIRNCGQGWGHAWWGNADLATIFALSVNHSLPSIHPWEYNGDPVGPRFAEKIFAANFGDTPGPQAYVKVGFRLFYESYQGTGNFRDVTWARAVAYQAPSVPGPLPILGAAATFGFSRQLRRRLKLSTNAVDRSYSL